MNSRCRAMLALCAVMISACGGSVEFADAADGTLHLNAGPHLLVDDLLVGSTSNVVRRPVTLVREELSQAPVITAADHHPFQPFFTVLHDTNSGMFRLWYGVPTDDFNTSRSRIAYTESRDGIHWTNSPRILDIGPVQFGASVIDERANCADQSRRYKLGWYFAKGLKIATSADGLNWKHLTRDVVIEHNHDINGIFWDSLRQRYTAILSFYITGPTWTGQRRITKQSTSTNLVNWSEPWPVITPDNRDEGETQFYAMDGFLARGDLLLGMVKVLRDDLKADNPPQPPEAYGIGYTTLAWTHNGRDWSRERVPFFDRNPRQGAWDHAHAWIDEQVPVGDEVYLYYGGYKSGHKVNRFQERQIGLIKMKRDRYIGWQAMGAGTLRTRPVLLSARKLFVNADASRGELRVQLLTPQGKPIKGFTFRDCEPIRADSVRSAVKWKTSLAKVRMTPVVIEFVFKDSTLFSFELE